MNCGWAFIVSARPYSKKGDAALDMSYLAMDKALTRNEPGVACDVLEEVSVL